MTLSELEREAIVLQVTVEVINSMVNREMLAGPSAEVEAQATFQSNAHQALFSVLLADLLEQMDKDLLGRQGSLLDALELVAERPSLDSSALAQELRGTVHSFKSWLETEITVPVWLPSIDREVALKLRRRDFITICGNISKHNPARLTRNAKRLIKLLDESGVSVDLVGALRALDDFYERFHTDILAYHSTALVEMLNNIRWAIHEYLEPEFARAYVPPQSEADPRYSYNIPTGLDNEYAQKAHWDLMNSVRERPWIPRFKGTRHLKGQY